LHIFVAIFYFYSKFINFNYLIMKKLSLLVVIFAVMASCCPGNSNKSEADAAKEAVVAPKADKKVVVARVVVKEGQEAAFIEVGKKLVEATREEPGNLFYSLYQSPIDPHSFIFYEEYKDEAAFGVHANSEHFKAFAAAIPDLLAEELKIDQF
jgi:quinol monooxygenase YgiN